jgi:hypothetical protein
MLDFLDFTELNSMSLASHYSLIPFHSSFQIRMLILLSFGSMNYIMLKDSDAIRRESYKSKSLASDRNLSSPAVVESSMVECLEGEERRSFMEEFDK